MERALTRTGHEATDEDSLLMRAWRMGRLTRLGIPLPLAQAAADRADWHQVAALVCRGCPPQLRFTSLAEAVPRMADSFPPAYPAPSPVADHDLWARVARYARCTDSSLDPDEWFPVRVALERARREAAAAIAVCNSCLVRGECLALSLRHWDIGQHGIWGGLTAADRARMRRPQAAGPRGRCGPAASAMIMRPSVPGVQLRLLKGVSASSDAEHQATSRQQRSKQ